MQTPQWKEDNVADWKGQEILNEKNMPFLNFFEVFSSSHCPAAVRKRERISQPQQLQRTRTWNWKISASLSWFCTQSSNIHTPKTLVVVPLNESPTTASDPAAEMAGNVTPERQPQVFGSNYSAPIFGETNLTSISPLKLLQKKPQWKKNTQHFNK